MIKTEEEIDKIVGDMCDHTENPHYIEHFLGELQDILMDIEKYNNIKKGD